MDLWTELGVDGHPAEALATIRRLRAEIDAVERDVVGRALAGGWSYAEVGRVLGISRQAVLRRLQRAEQVRRPRAAAVERARAAAADKRRRDEAFVLERLERRRRAHPASE